MRLLEPGDHTRSRQAMTQLIGEERNQPKPTSVFAVGCGGVRLRDPALDGALADPKDSGEASRWHPQRLGEPAGNLLGVALLGDRLPFGEPRQEEAHLLQAYAQSSPL